MNEDIALVRNLIHDVIALRAGIKQFYYQKIKELNLDITYEMMQVMAVLWRKTEVNQQDIAEAVQKSKASITPLIDNLCKRGLVTRISDPSDRRNNKIELTEKGFLFQETMAPVQDELFQRISKVSSKEEIIHLREQLQKIATAIV